jgi:hypothetical protein
VPETDSQTPSPNTAADTAYDLPDERGHFGVYGGLFVA